MGAIYAEMLAELLVSAAAHFAGKVLPDLALCVLGEIAAEFIGRAGANDDERRSFYTCPGIVDRAARCGDHSESAIGAGGDV